MSKQAIRLSKQWLISVGLLLAAGIISVSLFNTNKKIDIQPASELSQIVHVQAAEFAHTIPIQLRGFLRSQETLQILSPSNTQVERILQPSFTGSEFTQGQLLLALNKDAAQSAVYQTQGALAQSNLKLQQFKSTLNNSFKKTANKNNTQQLTQLEAQQSLAELQHKQALQHLAQCTVTAPFNGIFEKLLVQSNQIVQQGQLLATLANRDKLEIATEVSSNTFQLLTPLLSNPANNINAQLIKHKHTALPDNINLNVLLNSQKINAAQQHMLYFSVADKLTLKLGTLLDLIISAPTSDTIIKAPSSLLRNNKTIWLSNGQQLLIRHYQIIYQSHDSNFIKVVMLDGDPPLNQLSIVSSYLSTAKDNMLITVADKTLP